MSDTNSQQNLKALVLSRKVSLSRERHTLTLDILSVNESTTEGVGIDQKKGLWFAPRGNINLDVHAIGEPSSKVLPGEVFDVIDINNDKHIEIALEKIKTCLENEFSLAKL